MSKKKYDYAILGAGCAGLSLAMEMSRKGLTQTKSVVILDADDKRQNDRTWSYWEKGSGQYDHLLTHQWSYLEVLSQYGSHSLDISPYRYKMLRGLDYYNEARSIIASDQHLHWVTNHVEHVAVQSDQVIIKAGQDTIEVDHAFKSYYDPKKIRSGSALTTLQHFGGWYIQTATPVWDPDKATFMDFRLEQVAGQTRFCYVLPLSTTEALVEVAVFSSQPWKEEAYDDILRSYIAQYVTRATYRVTETEYGVIPMSTFRFWQDDQDRLTHIGTAGGAVKPSSGYAFKRIQQHSQWIVNQLIQGGPLSTAYFASRHYYYDATLLHVLLVQQVASDQVFDRLFSRNSPQRVLAFLNGETSLAQELRLCSSMPMRSFSRGLLASLTR